MQPHSTQPPYTVYRADIDGMRAIAVLCVIGNHAFPSSFPGGFIGVDIFFVISGYLITDILCSRLRRGIFSFQEFYARRVRRICPALVLVLVVSYGLGWHVLLAGEYKQLGKHVAGGAAFIANFIMWHEQGYFDNTRDTKPLMHLWSLGIEEQFYLVWPLVLSCAWRLRQGKLCIVLLLAIASFALNVASVYDDPVVTFYSPTTRWWELMSGALLAHGTHSKPASCASLTPRLDRYFGPDVHPPWKQAADTLRTVKTLLGAVSICTSLLAITEASTFPGWWALLPTLGAGLIISAGPTSWLNRVVLSNRLLVWIGLISYPLYLWHWPLLSFCRIIVGHAPSATMRTATVLATLLLAWLTYMLVERPIRLGRHHSVTTAVLLSCMGAIGVLGYDCYRHNGYELRPANSGVGFNSNQLAWSGLSDRECVTRMNMPTQFCLIAGNPRALTLAILGDSTANALAPGLLQLYGTTQRGVINIGQWGCPPIREVRSLSPNCTRLVKRAYDVVLDDSSIKVVVLAIFVRDMRWWAMPGVSPNANIVDKFAFVKLLLDSDIEALQRRGKRVVLTFDTPMFPFSAQDCIRELRAGSLARCSIPYWRLIDRQPYVGLFSHSYEERKDICVFRQSPYVSENGMFSMVDTQGRLLFRDDHHLSMFGSLRMAVAFQQSKCGLESELWTDIVSGIAAWPGTVPFSARTPAGPKRAVNKPGYVPLRP